MRDGGPLDFELEQVGGNLPTSPSGKILSPAAITFINRIGLQRVDGPASNLTVDASQVNQPKLSREICALCRVPPVSSTVI